MKIFSLEQYNIYLGAVQDAFAVFSTKKYSQIIILCDENTAKFCLPKIIQYIDNQKIKILEIESGEQHKTLKASEKIWSSMMEAQTDRKALMINLGGGVIGDMGGFCASTFKRGMDFIQIPTTLLSQVDASIGGKLGIDFQGVKNAIGVFQDPKAVFIDPDFLNTLSEKEIRSGFAEIIKHTLIADKSKWQILSKYSGLKSIGLTDFIEHSLLVKKSIVEKDPFEQNIRKALNFGHTIGHGVESYFLETQNPLLHGEAIAVGMICEAYLSMKKSTLQIVDFQTITKFITVIFGKIKIPSSIYELLLKTMRQDKKNEIEGINFTLLSEIGVFEINHTIDEASIIESLDFYNSL
jgi:3-dehydroquinate synthase